LAMIVLQIRVLGESVGVLLVEFFGDLIFLEVAVLVYQALTKYL